MAKEIGYPDSVGRGEDAHPGAAANDSEDARKEWAAPGHAGRSEATTPIGPQSGFTPLMSSEKPHGNANTQENAREEWGKGY